MPAMFTIAFLVALLGQVNARRGMRANDTNLQVSDVVDECERKSGLCPTAMCMLTSEQTKQGCMVGDGPLRRTYDGSCCPKQCHVTCPGESCPRPKGACPTARCARTHDQHQRGCNIGDGPLKVGSDGSCCPELCYVTCPGESCPKRKGICPVARCALTEEQQQRGCTVGDGPLQVRSDGSCCPKLCHVTCPGDSCQKQEGTCPMAKCFLDEERAHMDCSVGDGPLEINSGGSCCPKLCHMSCPTPTSTNSA